MWKKGRRKGGKYRILLELVSMNYLKCVLFVIIKKFIKIFKEYSVEGGRIVTLGLGSLGSHPLARWRLTTLAH